MTKQTGAFRDLSER